MILDLLPTNKSKSGVLSILKQVSFESLAGNDFSERGTLEEAHCERNLNSQLWSNASLFKEFL